MEYEAYVPWLILIEINAVGQGSGSNTLDCPAAFDPPLLTRRFSAAFFWVLRRY